ncbi:hypothetical protein CHISP_3618 [Chitinispirillum alkaliphilum]|nr:hypothetical protein CHISP_3618 [Chitinispirillum alkaliphilum]
MKTKTDTGKNKGSGPNRKNPSKKRVKPVAPFLQDDIEREIAALKESELRRPSMAINQFVDEYSAVLAQAYRDRSSLVNAGFDWSKMPRYDALFENLILSLGDSMCATSQTPEKIEFDRLIVEAQRCRVILKEVGAYIVKNIKDKRVSRYYKRAATGIRQEKCLTSILDLVALIREYPEIASQIRPQGVTVDSAYLTGATRCALDLLQLKGEAEIKKVPQAIASERKKRLVTICMKAQKDIKKFAYAAFRKDLQYYYAFYTSSARQVQSLRYKLAKQNRDQL